MYNNLKEFLEKNKEIIEDKNIYQLLINTHLGDYKLYYNDNEKLFKLLNKMEEDNKYTPTKYILTYQSCFISKPYQLAFTVDIKNKDILWFNTKEEAEEYKNKLINKSILLGKINILGVSK